MAQSLIDLRSDTVTRPTAAMRAAFTDDAVMHWPVTGERFEGADLIVRANAEYPEGWSIEVKAVDALADGRVHSLVEVRHGDGLFFGHSRFEFRGPSIAAVQEHWSTAEAPPAWRATLGAGYRRG